MKKYDESEINKTLGKLAFLLVGGYLFGILFLSHLTYILIVLIIVGIIPILFIAGYKTIDENNEGKEGYYAESGISFGTNGDRHEKYVKAKRKREQEYMNNKIANEIMEKK